MSSYKDLFNSQKIEAEFVDVSTELNSTLSNLTTANINTETVTSSNITTLSCGAMTSSSINATNVTINNLTIQSSISASTGSFTTLNASSASFTNMSATNGSISILTSTTATLSSASIPTLTATSANVTSGSISTLTSTSATLTSASIPTLTSTSATLTSASIPTLTSTSATLTSASIPTLTSTSASITTCSIPTLTSTSATITGATISTIYSGTWAQTLQSKAGTIALTSDILAPPDLTHYVRNDTSATISAVYDFTSAPKMTSITNNTATLTLPTTTGTLALLSNIPAPPDLSNYVTLDGTQNITGSKTLSNINSATANSLTVLSSLSATNANILNQSCSNLSVSTMLSATSANITTETCGTMYCTTFYCTSGSFSVTPAGLVDITGTQTITGNKSFIPLTGDTKINELTATNATMATIHCPAIYSLSNSSLTLKDSASATQLTVSTSGVSVSSLAGTNLNVTNASISSMSSTNISSFQATMGNVSFSTSSDLTCRTYGFTLPASSGTIALTSDVQAINFNSGYDTRTTLSIDGSNNVTQTANFTYYYNGIKYTGQATSNAKPSSTGIYYYYIDSASPSTCQVTQNFTSDLIKTKVLVGAGYWNNTNQDWVFFCDERHGHLMDGDTHYLLHMTEGTKYVSGLSLGNFTISDGSLNSHYQFTSTEGVILDEDYAHTITAKTLTGTMYVFYLTSTNTWNRIISDTCATTTGTGRLAFNKLTTGTWSLAEVTNNNFVLGHVLAINDARSDNRLICLLGQNEYGTLTSARAGAQTEINSIITSGLPMPEIVIVATVVFQTSNSYASTKKSKIVYADTSNNTYVSWLGKSITSSATVQNHNNLSGLQGGETGQYYHLTSSQYAGVDYVDQAQTISAVKTFTASPVISTITNTGTLTLPTSTGTLALVSQIPTDICTLTTAQTISAVKTFSSAPVISSITNTGTLTLPTSTGTLALVSQIPTDVCTLTTAQTISAVKTFTASPVISSITNTGTLTLPTTTGTLALLSDIPTPPVMTHVVYDNATSSISAVHTFSVAPVISSITNTGTLTLPTSTGTLALVSQLPDISHMVTDNTAQTISAVKTFTASPVISSITNTGTLTLPTTTGTLALVSQIPTDVCTLTTAQTISAVKTFTASPVISSITNTGTLTLPTTTGTLALVSQIPTDVCTLTTAQTISAVKTFTASPVISSITNTGTLTLPTSTGTLALVSQIPTDICTLTTAQTVSAVKTFTASPVISSITNGAYTITIPAKTGTVALLSDITAPANMVTTDTTQTISALKTFSAVSTFSNTTLATSSSNGAVVISGGLGVGGSIYAGTSIYASVALASEAPNNGSLGIALKNGAGTTWRHGIKLDGVAESGSDAGANLQFVTYKDDGKSLASTPITITRANGVVTFNCTTDASSSTAGGTIISGGLAVAKKCYIGTTLNTGGVATFSDTTDASSSTAGGTIISGGLAVAKKCYIGTGLYLPTSGGTASALNFYEEYDHKSNWTGCGLTFTDVNHKITRCGRFVTLSLNSSGYVVDGKASAGNYFTMSTVLPARFRPGAEFWSISIRALDNGVYKLGELNVKPDGNILIFAGIGTQTFSGGNTYTTGFYRWTATWSIY